MLTLKTHSCCPKGNLIKLRRLTEFVSQKEDIKLCRGKFCLKVFVVVIPKEGLGPTNPSLGMTPTIELYSAAFKDYIL